MQNIHCMASCSYKRLNFLRIPQFNKRNPTLSWRSCLHVRQLSTCSVVIPRSLQVQTHFRTCVSVSDLAGYRKYGGVTWARNGDATLLSGLASGIPPNRPSWEIHSLVHASWQLPSIYKLYLVHLWLGTVRKFQTMRACLRCISDN